MTEIVDAASPELSLREGPEVESRDYPEVVASTAKGEPQIAVFVCIGVHDLAGCENNLVVDDVVAYKTLAR